MNQQPLLSHGAPIHGSHNIPVELPEYFIAREDDLDAIRRTLKTGAAVLVHGPSGVGKTAVVAALAASYAELPGGVLWLDGMGDTVRSLVTRTARAYDLEVPALGTDLADCCARIREHLLSQQPLIVLDGRLQMGAAREFVRECASGVPLLVTHTVLVSGPWTPHEIAPLGRDETLSLMSHHAGEEIAEDVSRADTLLQALSGLPLSIQVAAHQLASGTTADEFTAQVPDLPPGQKNRAIGVLMAGYRMLSPDMQGMVMLLGTAFAGGASAELLCDVSGARPDVLHKRMQQLVDHGFATAHIVYGQSYYAVHELVHEFAQAFLRGKKRLNTMVIRYVQGLPAYLRRHADEHDESHYDRLASEMPNVLGAGMYAAAQGKVEFLREITRVLGASRSEGFVAERGFEPELDWLHYLIDHPAAAEEGVLAEMPEPEPVEQPAELDAFDLAPVTRPLAISESEIEDETPEDLAGLEMADVDVDERDQEQVAAADSLVEHDDEAEPLSVPDVPETMPETIVAAGDVVAPVASVPGDSNAEVVRYEQVLEQYQADGNVDDELAAIQALAKLSLEGANYEAVLAYLDRGTALAQQTENPQREGEMLVILGDLQADLERLDGAEMAYKEAISALRPVEAWLEIGVTLEKLGTVYMRLRRVDEALGVWQQALPIFEKENRPDLERKVLNRMGDVYARRLDWQPAKMHYTRALETAALLDDARAQFVQLSKLADLMENSGSRDAAITYYWKALHLAFALSDTEALGSTELALARLLIDDTVYLSRALQLLEAVVDLLPDDTDAQRLLSRAQTRRERLIRADVTLPLVEDSIEEYARRIFQTAPKHE